MRHSENINELAESLSKFQGEVVDVHKGKKGYGYDYADLASLLALVRPLASKYGLSHIQLPFSREDGTVGVTTRIMHVSGQWVESELTMPVDAGKGMSRAQAVGSVITYARRYALAGAFGIAQTDNDASLTFYDEVKSIADYEDEFADCETIQQLQVAFGQAWKDNKGDAEREKLKELYELHKGSFEDV